MDAEIKPAMTTEQWSEADTIPAAFDDWGSHAAAALALYGQPFGFTREDVDLLRGLEDAPDDQRLAVESLRKRVEALLPPED